MAGRLAARLLRQWDEDDGHVAEEEDRATYSEVITIGPRTKREQREVDGQERAHISERLRLAKPRRGRG